MALEWYTFHVGDKSFYGVRHPDNYRVYTTDVPHDADPPDQSPEEFLASLEAAPEVAESEEVDPHVDEAGLPFEAKEASKEEE